MLDEDNTHVVFGAGGEDMQVRLLVPKQYSTLKVSFEGASNQGAAANVNLANPFANMWHFDTTSDPCNVIATSKIPVRYRCMTGAVYSFLLSNGATVLELWFPPVRFR